MSTRTKGASQQQLDENTLRVVFYFVERLNGVLGKTHLQKLLFLTDLLAAKKLKTKVSALNYKRYKHGPFSDEVDLYTAHLAKGGNIDIREFPFNSDPKKKYVRYFVKSAGSVREKLLSELGTEKVMLLDEIVSSYGNLSLNSLLDIVYKLPEVKDKEMNDILDVAKTIDSEEEETEEAHFDVL
ncbi:MAG TPA: type II toxin-antitoxin system antitoxin SocA domain-containing protein [Candidatus Saccharimonadales bacterium]|nr:type II toxin-antitoxin system antitoxin SocA domain-containing protein [Candidatus Saccharimonadales bacterium]